MLTNNAATLQTVVDQFVLGRLAQAFVTSFEEDFINTGVKEVGAL